MIINLFSMGGGNNGGQVPYDAVLANNTPAQIQGAARAGIASSLWSVGDATAPVQISAFSDGFSGTTLSFYIAGFDHNSSVEGTGITFLLGKINSVDVTLIDSAHAQTKSSGTWFNMNNSSSNSGGWGSSRMRTVLMPLLLAALPQAWKDVIVSTYKYTDNTGGGSDTASYVTLTSDKLFLLAEYEVFGTRTNANSAEKNKQAQYQFYINGASKKKYKHSDTGTVCGWWFRSVRASSSTQFLRGNSSGTQSNGNANYCYGVSPAFRVA